MKYSSLVGYSKWNLKPCEQVEKDCSSTQEVTSKLLLLIAQVIMTHFTGPVDIGAIQHQIMQFSIKLCQILFFYKMLT